MAILDLIKVIEDKYLITAGIDPKIRIWNIESEKIISKFEIHPYCTIHMVCYKEFAFTYGYDMKLVKYNFKNKTLEYSLQVESNCTAIKILKCVEE